MLNVVMDLKDAEGEESGRRRYGGEVYGYPNMGISD
jgi:hypothetical protein